MAPYPKLKFLPGPIPSWIKRVNSPATEAELDHANAMRRKFFRDENRTPYMVDIVRAFRLAKEKKSYIEVGSRDKGNVAWVSSLLSSNATIVDVDLENDVEAEARVRREIGKNQNYFCIEGNSISEDSIAGVEKYIPRGTCDVIFLDSNHMYYHFLNEMDLYMEILRPGGFMLVHDVVWEGSADQKGKAPACEMIDRHMPVYLVNGNSPVTRFMRMQKNDASWGCVGIIQKPTDPLTRED